MKVSDTERAVWAAQYVLSRDFYLRHGKPSATASYQAALEAFEAVDSLRETSLEMRTDESDGTYVPDDVSIYLLPRIEDE